MLMNSEHDARGANLFFLQRSVLPVGKQREAAPGCFYISVKVMANVTPMFMGLARAGVGVCVVLGRVGGCY